MGRTVDFRIRKPENIPVDELTEERLSDLLVNNRIAEDLVWGPVKEEGGVAVKEEVAPEPVKIKASDIELPVKEITNQEFEKATKTEVVTPKVEKPTKVKTETSK